MPENYTVIVHVLVGASSENIEDAIERIKSLFVPGVIIIPDPLPPPARPPLKLPPRGRHGVDVSKWQDGLSMADVKRAGYDFVMIKATEGTHGVDAQAERFYREAGNAGMLRGFYHFFHPDMSTDDQARNFISRVTAITGGGWGELTPAIDFETTSELGPIECGRRLLSMLLTIQGVCGAAPMLYTGSYKYDENIAPRADLDGMFPLWIAHYTTRPTPRLPRGWADYALWQYSASGRVDGHEGNVDLNRSAPE